MLLIYLGGLYDLLRGDTDRRRFLGSLVLAGGALFVALHAVSDIGITGALGASFPSFASQHDPGVAYTLSLTDLRPRQRRGGAVPAACLLSQQACW